MSPRKAAAALVALASTLVVLSGCKHAPDLPACDGTCVDVQVDQGNVTADIRQFRVDGTIPEQSFTGHAKFPDTAAGSIGFPAYFSLKIGNHTGTLALTVSALDSGGVVQGFGTGIYAIQAGGRGSVKVTLMQGMPNPGSPDMASTDIAGPPPPDLTLGPDLSPSEGGPADMVAVPKIRYASFIDPSYQMSTDFYDGVKIFGGIAPATASAYMPTHPGMHTVDIRPFMNGNQLLSMQVMVSVDTPQLLTVFSAESSCMNATYGLFSYTSPPIAADPMHALLTVANAACAPNAFTVAIDGGPSAMLAPGGTMSMPVSSGGMHHVAISDANGNLLGATDTPQLGGSEVWSVFVYRVVAPPADMAVPPDLATPDLAMPDLLTPDLLTPDLAAPPKSDLLMPDMTPPPADLNGVDLFGTADITMPPSDMTMPPSDMTSSLDPNLRFLSVRDAP